MGKVCNYPIRVPLGRYEMPECVFYADGCCLFYDAAVECSVPMDKVCIVWLTQTFEWTTVGYIPTGRYDNASGRQ